MGQPASQPSRSAGQARVSPVRLGPKGWASGETVWLPDVAADRQQATLVLAHVRQLAGGRAVKGARLAARLTDPELAAKPRGTAAKGQGRQQAANPTAFREPRGRAQRYGRAYVLISSTTVLGLHKHGC